MKIWRILALRLGIYSLIPLLPPLKSLHNGYFYKNYNHQLFLRWSMCQGVKKVMFTSCHWGKLRLTLLAQTSFLTSPKNVVMFRLISQFFCNLNSSKKLHLLIGQVNNRIHLLDSKIHQPQAIRHYFLCQWCAEVESLFQIDNVNLNPYPFQRSWQREK